LSLEHRELISTFAEAHDLAAVAWGDPGGGVPEPVMQRREPLVRMGGVDVVVPAGVFLQATRESEAALVAEVLAGAAGAGQVADLFSGIGTFALPLVADAKVHAVEGDAELARALEAAVNRTAGRVNLSVEVRDLFRRPLSPVELKKLDAVVFDPPRAGAREQAVALAESSVPVVIAVSCNPATFARDLRLLVDGGYVLQRVVPVDQFLWSPHVEMVGVLRR
jgi:23S rRNA (uracil1939-C5)-methyltransferase